MEAQEFDKNQYQPMSEEIHRLRNVIGELEEENKELRIALEEWTARPRNLKCQEQVFARNNRIQKFKEEVLALCEAYGLNSELLLNRSKTRRGLYVLIRGVLAKYYRDTFNYTYMELMECMGYSNHTTVLHLYQRMNDKLYCKDRLALAAWKKVTDFYKGIPNEIDLMEV